MKILTLTKLGFKFNNSYKHKYLKIFKTELTKSDIMFVRKLMSSDIPLFYIDLFVKIANKLKLNTLLNELNIIDMANINRSKSKFKNISELMPHQNNAIDLFNYVISNTSYKGILLLDEPGLGKTKTSITLNSLLLKKYPNNNLLVIAPVSLLGMWRKALVDAFPNIKIGINDESNKFKINIVNYEFVHKLNTAYTQIIIDEAHNLHNIEQNRYFDIFNISNKSKYCFPLTATPVRESSKDLLSILALIDPYLTDINILSKIHDLSDSFPAIHNYLIFNKIGRVSTLTTKDEVSDKVGETNIYRLIIPATIDEIKENNLSIYDSSKSAKKVMFDLSRLHKMLSSANPEDLIKISNNSIDDKTSHLGKLMLLYNKYIDSDGKINVNHSINSKVWHEYLFNTIQFIFEKKPELILEMINKFKKMIFISKSREGVNLITKILSKNNITVINISAEDNFKNRESKIIEFNKSKENNIILISTYQILEAGHNIPSAKGIFIIDYPFRPHSYIQIINRTQRLSNITDEINVLYLQLGQENVARYTILKHDYLIFKNYYKIYNAIISTIREEIDMDN